MLRLIRFELGRILAVRNHAWNSGLLAIRSHVLRKCLLCLCAAWMGGQATAADPIRVDEFVFPLHHQHNHVPELSSARAATCWSPGIEDRASGSPTMSRSMVPENAAVVRGGASRF